MKKKFSVVVGDGSSNQSAVLKIGIGCRPFDQYALPTRATYGCCVARHGKQAKAERRYRRQFVGRPALFETCGTEPNDFQCLDAHKQIGNPYCLGDQPSGTENSGWLDAWTPAPSAYAINARHASDVATGIAFARKNRSGRRVQLPRDVERAGLPIDLDARDEQHHAARRLRRPRLRGQRRAPFRPSAQARARCGWPLTKP